MNQYFFCWSYFQVIFYWALTLIRPWLKTVVCLPYQSTEGDCRSLIYSYLLAVTCKWWREKWKPRVRIQTIILILCSLFRTNLIIYFFSLKAGHTFKTLPASLPNNNLDLNSWYTFYSRALFPNRYHLPYLHVLGCWEWQIDWENSHITTQWERECVMCSKQRNTTVMALTPSKCLLSTQPNHIQRVCVYDGRQ